MAGGIATVDLNERFAGGRDTGSLLARLAELVRTLTGVQGTKKVQLLLDGSPAVARFPGVNTGKPISFRTCRPRTCRSPSRRRSGCRRPTRR